MENNNFPKVEQSEASKKRMEELAGIADSKDYSSCSDSSVVMGFRKGYQAGMFDTEANAGLLSEVIEAIEFACAPDMWISNGEFHERFEYKYEEWYQDKLNAVLQKLKAARGK